MLGNMRPYLLAQRIQASFHCRFDEFWTFKIDIVLDILNTVLEVVMWYFLAEIIDPSTLGYENVGYLPFILVGSIAIFFVDSVYANFTKRFYDDRENGLFKLAYLSNIGVIEYFLINFFVSSVFDVMTVFIPMVICFYALIQVVGSSALFYLGFFNMTTLLVALLIFIVGNLGFQLMTVGSILFLKQGDPIGFFMEQFNRLFSGQFFPLSVLPKFLAYLPKILPSAYIILIWRETLFNNVTLFDPSIRGLLVSGFIVNLFIFALGLYLFYYGMRRAKIEGRWY